MRLPAGSRNRGNPVWGAQSAGQPAQGVREMEQYQVRSMVDGLGGVYEGEGSLQGTYDTLEAAVEAADGQPTQYVMRVSDGKSLMPDGTWA